MEQQFKALKHKYIENKWRGGGHGSWIDRGGWEGNLLTYTQPYPYLYPSNTTIDNFYEPILEDYDLITITINY